MLLLFPETGCSIYSNNPILFRFLIISGHTFMPNNETFLPRYTLDSPTLVFPAVNAKEATYRTMLLNNTGTTPIFFDVEKDPTR